MKFTFATIGTILVALIAHISSVSSGIACAPDGTCYDTDDVSDRNRLNVVCNPDNAVVHTCKSCTYKNCCHKLYTSKDFQCPISGGWTAPEYTGSIVLQPSADGKRDISK